MNDTHEIQSVIKVSDVLNMLKNGKTRNEIAEHYNLEKWELKELFKHPNLKNRKTIKPRVLSFTIMNDVENENLEINENELVEEFNQTL